jgi:hypothetical protein
MSYPHAVEQLTIRISCIDRACKKPRKGIKKLCDKNIRKHIFEHMKNDVLNIRGRKRRPTEKAVLF